MIDAFILSIVQGLTEFLPISSSGHLVLFEKWFRFGTQDNHLFNVILHFGTMIATIVVFKLEVFEILKVIFSRRLIKIRNLESIRKNNILWLAFIIIIGSLPTAFIGLIFRDLFKSLASNVFIISIAFLLTGSVLFSIRFFKSSTKTEYNKITIWDTLIIGLFQGLAITPGISRSGITISAGLLLGIQRDKIGRYSFLLSLPAIFGATILELSKVNLSEINVLPLIIGITTSFVVGYIALKILLRFVNRGQFTHFSYYCFVIGIISMVVSFYY